MLVLLGILINLLESDFTFLLMVMMIFGGKVRKTSAYNLTMVMRFWSSQETSIRLVHKVRHTLRFSRVGKRRTIPLSDAFFTRLFFYAADGPLNN